MKRIVIVGMAVALLVLLGGIVAASVVWVQTSRIERRLPGQLAEGDRHRWYCVVPPSGFGLCTRLAPTRLLPEDDDAKVLRPSAAACFVKHQISTDEASAVCAYTTEGCEVVRRGFAGVADIDAISECATVDLLDLFMSRVDARAVVIVASGLLIGWATLAWLLWSRWQDERQHQRLLRLVAEMRARR